MSHRSLILGALALSLGCSAAASAELLDLNLGFPLTTYDNQGTTAYDPATQQFNIDARPLAVRFTGGSPPRVVGVTGDPAIRSVTVRALVDSSGNLVGGGSGDDLVVIGQVDQDGDGNIDFAGVLLTGEVVEFGFENTDGVISTDQYNFRFTLTGGALAALYPANSDIGMTVTSEMSTFTGDFTLAFAGEAKGNIAPTPARTGACCLETGECIIATAPSCAAQGGSYQGDNTLCTPTQLGGIGTYKLGNHPDGDAAAPFYGLRLDELFNVTDGHDIFSFDFEAPGACVFLDYDGTKIRIHGRAFGGRDTGDGYDPMWRGFVDLNFCYTVVASAPGDDDLIVVTPSGTNAGTVTWVNTGEIIPIYDYAGDFGFTFRFGNEDNDAGHRGFNGLSGWGWLNHRDPDLHVAASDWIFTARPLCIPPQRTGACCLPSGSCEVLTQGDCEARHGQYQGDGIQCTPAHLGEPGTYRLANHPDGNAASPHYGLRLDELFDVTPGAADIFTFDFEAPGTAVFLDYDGASIRIFGRAFGGRDVGSSYDPAYKGYIDIDFTYTVVAGAPGDDDLIVVTPNGTNSGTVTWVNTGEIIPIYDYAGNFGYTFRFGNEDNDNGHRGFDGLSGWGWLNHRDPAVHRPSSDWIFTARPVCRRHYHAVLHYDFDEQNGSWVNDRVGDVDLQFKRGNGSISWVNDSTGTGVYLNQSTSSGTARLQTTSTSVASGLRQALQATNAITVQVQFKQDGGSSSGARIVTFSSETNLSSRNFSVIGDPRYVNGKMVGFDNWTRLRTNTGTFSDGPDDCWDRNQPVVYAFTYDANTGDLLRIYINGRLVHTDSTSKGDFGNWSNRHFLLGNEQTQNRPFKGRIYDVKIWNEALDGAELWQQAQDLMTP